MQQHLRGKSDLYNPDMPDASAVMASLLCVTTIYATKPSFELAKLALSLARTLTAPEYAETELICSISKRILMQWGTVVKEYEQTQTDIGPLRTSRHYAPLHTDLVQ